MPGKYFDDFFFSLKDGSNYILFEGRGETKR
jgi:hypothetical protein